MQNMINKNISPYQNILNASAQIRPNSPQGGGFSHCRSPSASKETGQVSPSQPVPNFQKKLKKYISKRATELKKNNNG